MHDFKAKVDLVWMNSIKFNGKDSAFAALALEGQLKFRKAIEKVCHTREEEWARKLIKTSRLLREAAGKLSKKVVRDIKHEVDRVTGED
jgi:hypothetical protein